jgi:hypothetical protein
MRNTLAYLMFIPLLLLTGCGSGHDQSEADRDAQEYQMIQAELKLAELEKPYLVINFDKQRLRLMLKGAVVWEFPINIETEDADEVADFVRQFRSGHRLVRTITTTHLYEYKNQTPDSVLEIISSVTKFAPELMQRKLPARFELHWGNSVVLDVRTGVEGEVESGLKNTLFGMRQILQNPLGAAEISVKMDSVHAMTLYDIAQPGLPTLVQPPVQSGS